MKKNSNTTNMMLSAISKRSVMLLTLMVTVMASYAQDLATGFFNDNYLYKHDFNPAVAPEKGYVTLPIIGGLNIGANGNIGLKNVLFKKDGELVTFMNERVDKSEFKIHDNNKLLLGVDLKLLDIGFKGIGGYNTIQLSTRANIGATLPGDAFRLAKDGVQNKTYDLSNLGLRATEFAEFALGHSHKINEHLRVGAKLKFLVGFADMEFKNNSSKITLGEDNYHAEVDAQLQLNVKGLKFEHEPGTNNIREIADDPDFDIVNGFGFAADLGVDYKLNDNWDFSFALLDLGAIRWKANLLAKSSREFNTDGYVFNVSQEASNNFEDTFSQMGKDIEKLYELEDMGDTGSMSRGIGATMNIGVSWRTPFYDKLVFGLLNTSRFQGKYSWTDFRLSANVRPVKAIALSLSGCAGTFGVGYGFMVDIQAKKGIDIYLGMDRVLGKLSKQGIPLNSNLQLSMGMAFPF